MSLRSFLASNRLAFDIWIGTTSFFAAIHWPRIQAVINGGVYYSLKEEDHDKIRKLLKENYLVVLTRRKSHLTTYLIQLVSWLATRKSSHYAHALMNVEGDIQNNIDFKLIEATAPGVHYSTFMQVFDCDSVALLKPRGVSLEDWTAVLDIVKGQYGYQYDNLFDITDEKNVSCVEMIYQGIKHLTAYKDRFPNLVRLLEETGNDLTPQMLYDCNDMDVVFEVRR